MKQAIGCQMYCSSFFLLICCLFIENGRAYYFQEIDGWLKNAGFKGIVRMVINLPIFISVLVGNK
ncbi:MAG: hypothetical protein ACYSR7_04635 [Planctomycetota bacterium]